MNIFGAYPQVNLLKTFDSDLIDFYKDILDDERNSLEQLYSIFIAMKKVIHARRTENLTGTSNILYDTHSKRWAYMFKYSTFSTSAVAYHLLQLLKSNPLILENALWQHQINICCLGGGPSTDIVAISKILSSAQKCFWLQKRIPVELRVTIIDVDEDWKSMAESVIENLEDYPEFFDSERFSLSFRFIKADLTQSLGEDVQESLRNADIITMVNVLSAVNRTYSDIRRMICEIIRHMKKEAFLFYLDSSICSHHNIIKSAFKGLGSFSTIYGPHVHELHTLSMNSVKKYINMYGHCRRLGLCHYSSIISVAAWSKKECLSRITSKHRDVKYLREKVSNNVKELVIFHRRVRRYFKKFLIKTFDKYQKFLGRFYEVEDNNSDEEDNHSGTEDEDRLFFPTRGKCKRILYLS